MRMVDDESSRATSNELPVVDYRYPETHSASQIDLSNPLYPLALAATAAVFGLRVRTGDSGLLASLGLVAALSWYVACRIYRDALIPPRWRPALMTVACACALCTVNASVGLQHRLDQWYAYGFRFPDVFLPAIVLLIAYVVLHGIARRESSRRRQDSP